MLKVVRLNTTLDENHPSLAADPAVLSIYEVISPKVDKTAGV